jgi:hydrogenase nickel incorporation protein HypA/HybF
VHELAITQSILEIAENEARRSGARRINKIKLRLGSFTGLVKEAVEFSFDAIKSGTLAEDGQLEIEVINLRTRCPGCGDETASEQPVFLCPRCAIALQIVSGREMQIEYIDVD